MEIKDLLLKIIERGILNTRAALANGDIEQASIEIYHIHNLPSVIYQYSFDRINYYLTVERKEYEKKSKEPYMMLFREIWKELEIIVSAIQH